MKKTALILAFVLAACGREPAPAVNARKEPLPDSIRQELTRLGTEDQALRTDLSPEKMMDTTFAREMLRTDSARTRRLHAIVEHFGWPDTMRAGAQASNAAFLILQHSPDYAFQKEMAPTLEKLAAVGEVPKQDVALLVDRVLMHDSLPQKYGTQFKLVDGRWVMHPVEDEAHLEERRAAMGLPSMEEYMKLMEDFYKAPVTRK